MIDNNKTYGFTIAVKELRETVPNIWRYASAYKRMNNLTSKGLWEMFVEPKPEPEKKEPTDEMETPPLPEEILRSDPGRNGLPDIDPEAMEGESYNMCHFWSNFEIARLSFFRSKEYEDFFEMMDRSGGFWMERVRSYLFALPSTPSVQLANCVRISGVMLPSTLLPPVLSFPPATSTTSVTSGTDTLRSSIAQRMRPSADSFPASRISRLRHGTSARGPRRMTTGSTGIRPRRTAWDADAVATLTSSTSRAKRVAAWRNGLTWLAGGLAHRAPSHSRSYRKSQSKLATPLAIGHDGNGHERRSGMASKPGRNDETESATTEPEISALRFMSDFVTLAAYIHPVAKSRSAAAAAAAAYLSAFMDGFLGGRFRNCQLTGVRHH